MDKKRVKNIAWVFPQLTTEMTTIDFLGNLELCEKLFSLVDKHLKEIPEEEQNRWLINAALTGLYYSVQLENYGGLG